MKFELINQMTMKSKMIFYIIKSDATGVLNFFELVAGKNHDWP